MKCSLSPGVPGERVGVRGEAALWRLEFANALLMAQRRGRISEDWRKAVIEQAGGL